MATSSANRQPPRWKEPLDPAMTPSVVSDLLKVAPFSQMRSDDFSLAEPLDGILQFDSRMHNLQQGDIIVREGDYGSSCFMILSGSALVSKKSLPPELLGRETKKKKGWTRAIAQLWTNSRYAEAREDRVSQGGTRKAAASDLTSSRDGSGARIFLHDIPRVIGASESVTLGPGEIFGDTSALTRSARSATVVANSKMLLLEIRWQGFRELMRRNEALGKHIEQRYRQKSLIGHLAETPIFSGLSEEKLARLANQTEFLTFGNYQWSHNFQSNLKKDISQQILAEPLIAEQNHYVDGLILIRSGFARLSRRHGDGHQTIAYLGKGETFGFRELAHNWRTGEQRPWMLSLRSLGFVDVLKIPVRAVEELVLPTIAKSELPPPLASSDRTAGNNRRMGQRRESMDSGLMEFLVGKRYINGTQAMMIDLDRCTRCDDCVRACASTHNNNPRFVRDGETHGRWMIAHACMHCLDPVCMIGCPTGAIGRNRETGNVTINDFTCIGCSTCANNCPYDNIQMVQINNLKGSPMLDSGTGLPIVKATKCDFCDDQPSGPACQRACPHDALVRIDLNSPDDVTQWTKGVQ